MASILITGGAGFIGSHTAEALLTEGHRVRILDRLDPQVHGEGAPFPSYLHRDVERIRGDVRDPSQVQSALAGIDAVYHFAALTGVGQSMYEVRSYVDTNCVGTATLLEVLARRQQPLRRLVLSSSRAVYGEGTHRCLQCGVVYPPLRSRADLDSGRFEVPCPQCGQPTTPIPTAEDRPLSPISVYGWTKKAQEELCLGAARNSPVPVVALRYFNVYGSRQSLKNPYTGVVSIFYNRLMHQQPISLYERGKPLRDFVHISDVVRANVLALDAEAAVGACINIGSGEQSSIRDLALALADACGQRPDLRDLGEFRVGDVAACVADMQRAQQLLGYQPRTSLRDGVKEFVAWAVGQSSEDGYERTTNELRAHGLFGQARQG